MLSETEKIHIACGLDENYAPHLATLLISISRSASAKRDIVVHVLDDQITADSKRAIERVVPDISILWYPVIEHQALALDPLLQISRATFLRLLMDEILPTDVRRIIYLDVDVIVAASLDDLWDTDIGTSICGAVVDPGVPVGPFADKFGLSLPDAYFNAGIMLFDMDRVRDSGILRDALRLLLEDRTRYEFADQDALNVVLWNRWHALDPSWNFQRCFFYLGPVYARAKAQALVHGPRIIHFTESIKPWTGKEWHPYVWLYLKCLRVSPFRARVMRSGKIGLLHFPIGFLRYVFKARRL